MITFRYEKLYADLVSREGMVCIVYSTCLELLGLSQRSAGYEVYRPDGSRTLVHAIGPAHVSGDRGAGLEIEFPTRPGPFALRFEPEPSPAPAEDQHPTEGLTWRVVVLASSGQASGVLGEREPLRGVGYSDRVTLSKIPRQLGLRRIQWGRAHLAAAPLAFTRLTLASGDHWQCAVDARGVSSVLELTTHVDGLARVRSQNDGELSVDAHRCLHRGSALDRERFPSLLARGLVRALSGPMDEVRSLSRARRVGGAEGIILHEDVRLG